MLISTVLKKREVIAKWIISLSLFFLAPLLHAQGNNQTRIHIMGEIVGQTCKIKTDEIHVEFGNITNKDLYFHKRLPSIPFSIELTSCSRDFEHDAVVTFTGNESSVLDLQGFIALDASSQASGIAIGLEESSGKFLPLWEESQGVPVDNEDIVLHFNAFVQAEARAIKDQSIKLGEFTATANFLIEYE